MLDVTRIKANQNVSLNLTPSSLSKDFTTILKISPLLKDYISSHTNEILDIQHLQKFKKKAPSGQQFRQIVMSAEEIKNSSLVIPGVKIYRYHRLIPFTNQESPGTPTYYGYIIENYKAFNDYCKKNNLSDLDVKVIYACMNRWFSTSGNKNYDIIQNNLLPVSFRDDLKRIKEYHASNNYESKFVTNIRDWNCWIIQKGNSNIQQCAEEGIKELTSQPNNIDVTIFSKNENISIQDINDKYVYW